jgi:hypothetical protein
VWDTQLQGVVGMIVASSQPAATKAAFAIPSEVLTKAWPQLPSIMRPRVPRNPYKGLQAFTEHDARDFFGREVLIDELATAVETALTGESKDGQQACLLTVVLGPSGSGKSSVVMAGLLPCLRDGRVLNSKEWVYLDPVFPGAHPLETLAVSLAKQLPARGPVSIHGDLASASARSLHLLVSQLTSSSRQKVVLLVDQFEEVFTLTTDEAERRHFFELLVAGVTEPNGPLFVILTLRADFYNRPMQYPELFRLIDNHHVSVLPLGRDDLRKVIEQPTNLPDIVMQVDQAGWHRAKDLQVPANIRLIFQPAYSPEVNPVEHLWEEIREKYLHNRVFPSLKELIEVLCQALTELTEDKQRLRSMMFFPHFRMES